MFLQVARDFKRFRGDSAALRRWVFAIAHHRLIDDRRRRARRPVEVDAAPVEVAAVEHPEPVDPEVVEALGALTPDQREVVTLRFVGDLSLEDVAKITRRRVGAVKALQHRGLEQLERLLAESAGRDYSAEGPSKRERDEGPAGERPPPPTESAAPDGSHEEEQRGGRSGSAGRPELD